LTGLDAVSYDGTIDLNLSFALVNESYYTGKIILSTFITINSISITRIIFDKTAIEATGNDYIDYGIVASTNNNASALSTTIPPNILPSNLFYGIHSFTIAAGLS